MKLYFIIKHKFIYCITMIVVIILSLLLISCMDSSVRSSSVSNNVPVDVYVCGNADIGKGGQVAVYWKNGKMVPLTKTPSDATCIAVAGSNICVGGYYYGYSYAGEGRSVLVPVYWKNGKSVVLSVLDSTKSSMVFTIFINGDDVYAGGYNSNRYDYGIAGYWKNGKWTALEPANSKYNSAVKSIFVSDNDVYAAGFAQGTCYWKNGNKVILPSVDNESKHHATSIFVVGQDVYVGGYREKGDITYWLDERNTVAGYWKNGKWTSLPSFDSQYYYSKGNSIFVSGKDIYVGGYVTGRSKLYLDNLARYVDRDIASYWKNDKCIALKTTDNEESLATSIFVFGNDVYVGGYIGSLAQSIPGYWKNGEWIELGSDGKVSSIVVVPRPTAQ